MKRITSDKGRVVALVIAGIVAVVLIWLVAIPIWKRDAKYLMNEWKNK